MKFYRIECVLQVFAYYNGATNIAPTFQPPSPWQSGGQANLGMYGQDDDKSAAKGLVFRDYYVAAENLDKAHETLVSMTFIGPDSTTLTPEGWEYVGRDEPEFYEAEEISREEFEAIAALEVRVPAAP